MLGWLWTRLSEGGPQVSISGRALGRFPAGEVERLLRARALLELPKADGWSLCARCECGLDARPIRRVGDRLLACCPLDAAEDEILEDRDLARFGVDPDRLAGRIAASGGLSGGVARIGDSLWSIGAAPSGVVAMLCADAGALEAPGMILTIRAAAGGRPVTILADDFDVARALRLGEAGLDLRRLRDVMRSDGSGTDRLDAARLADVAGLAAPSAAVEPDNCARLRILRGRRALRLDGRDIVLSLTGFDAVLGAAEKVVAGEVMLTYQEIHSLTNRASHRDVVNEVRDQFERHGLTREEAFDLVKTLHGRGITIGLPSHEIDIRD